MQILRLHIENFGRLHDFDMELHSGLNRICADNGWGKSTLAAFIKAMFYGLEYTTKRSLKENERKRYLPWQGGPFGGSLEFLAGDRRYRVERTFGEKDKEDQFALYDLETGLESSDYSERLGEELFRVDRAAFARSCFFAQQDFAASINDSLNAGLTHVEEDAGDMQNYERAVSSLEERMKYYQKTGNRGQIGKLTEARSALREKLAVCRNKEDAIPDWKRRVEEKEREEQELTERIGLLEAQVKEAQEYREREARKMQYDLLRSQAETKEMKLAQLGAELGAYTGAPPSEEELDRCREQIYHLETLRMQQKAAEETLARKTETYQDLEKEAADSPAMGKGLFVFAGLWVALGAAALLMEAWRLAGIGLLALGLIFAGWVLFKNRRAGEQRKIMENRLSQASEEMKASRDVCGGIQKEVQRLEKRIGDFLRVSAETDFQELENRWKLLRQQSQNYILLKQSYEAQRKEAARSKEAFADYCGKFSPEELLNIQNISRPDGDPKMTAKELEQCRRRKESLIIEQRDMHHQIRMLEERSEQIPELMEEEERLSGQLEEAMLEHGLLEKTIKYLKTARDNFSVRYLKELQQGMESYMKLLAPEELPETTVDVKLKVKVREKGATRDLDYMSAGWQDLIQLAERFSIIDALYKEEQPVLILDDPFVNLDDKKQKRMLKLLEEMAKKRQMISFTCREM